MSCKRADRCGGGSVAYGPSSISVAVPAEQVHRAWQADAPGRRSLVIVRPAAVLGEGNRGNVYQLLRQIASRRFVMVGSGHNRKSMAYVGNVSALLCMPSGWEPAPSCSTTPTSPTSRCRSLWTPVVPRATGAQRDSDSVRGRLPRSMRLGGRPHRQAPPISAIRVRKFCSTTTFSAHRLQSTGFEAPTALREALIKTIKHELAAGESLNNP